MRLVYLKVSASFSKNILAYLRQLLFFFKSTLTHLRIINGGSCNAPQFFNSNGKIDNHDKCFLYGIIFSICVSCNKIQRFDNVANDQALLDVIMERAKYATGKV